MYNEWNKELPSDEDIKKSLSVDVVHTKKILGCDMCEGTGLRSNQVLTDYHKGLYDIHTEKCTKCRGFGRYILETKTAELRNSSTYSKKIEATEENVEEFIGVR